MMINQTNFIEQNEGI